MNQQIKTLVIISAITCRREKDAAKGKTPTENEKANPEDWLTFWKKPHLFSSNTIEPFTSVQERMVETINELAKKHPFENICIVTHSIALKLLIDYMEKNTLENLWSTPAIPSASLSLIKVNNEVNEILFKYDTSHIQE